MQENQEQDYNQSIYIQKNIKLSPRKLQHLSKGIDSPLRSIGSVKKTSTRMTDESNIDGQQDSAKNLENANQ
jgi:hypothetical protein